MVTGIPFRVSRVVDTPRRFEKQLKKLSPDSQKEFETVIHELLTGTLTPGRNLEKKQGTEATYTVRLDIRNRFSFVRNEDNSIKPVAIGDHQLVYRNR